MPRKVAKVKDVGVDKEKSVVKKDVVKRGRKMRGGGKLNLKLQQILSNKTINYDDVFDKINVEFDKIRPTLKEMRTRLSSNYIIKNIAKNTHDKHIAQIDKFKSKNIQEIPNLLDLFELCKYINVIGVTQDGYNKEILYRNIIIIYIYNFFEIITKIIVSNSVDIDIADNNAAPALAPTPPPTQLLQLQETDDAIIERMEAIYKTNEPHFIDIDNEIIEIYKYFKYMLEFIITFKNMGSTYDNYDIKKYLLKRKPSISKILNENIPNIEGFIKKIKNATSTSKLFNTIYLNNLQKEIDRIRKLCNEWIKVIDEATK
jgi:hypothetical protein